MKDPKTLEEALKIITNQRQYITQVEGERNKALDENKRLINEMNNATAGMDGELAEYVLESRAENYKTKAIKKLNDQYGESIVNAVMEDWDEWLDKNLDLKRTSLDFFIQSFYMAYGKAFGDKNHKVHEAIAGKTSEPQVPDVTEQDVEQVGEEEETVEISDTIMPPGISGEGDGTIDPQTNTPPSDTVNNTDDAIKLFRQRMAKIAANPYEN